MSESAPHRSATFGLWCVVGSFVLQFIASMIGLEERLRLVSSVVFQVGYGWGAAGAWLASANRTGGGRTAFRVSAAAFTLAALVMLWRMTFFLIRTGGLPSDLSFRDSHGGFSPLAPRAWQLIAAVSLVWGLVQLLIATGGRPRSRSVMSITVLGAAFAGLEIFGGFGKISGEALDLAIAFVQLVLAVPVLQARSALGGIAGTPASSETASPSWPRWTAAAHLLVVLGVAGFGLSRGGPENWGGSDGPASGPWRESSVASAFEIEFPAEPKRRSSGFGPESSADTFEATGADGLMYRLEVENLPVSKDEGVLTQLVQAFAGDRAKSNDEIEPNGYPGRELFGATSDGKSLRARLFLAGHRRYLIEVRAPDETGLLSEPAIKFLRSLKLDRELIDAETRRREGL
jgi:hypothetical protein